MIELILKFSKYYVVYFLFMFTLFFCIAYFYFSPYFANKKPIALNDSNTYILLKKENINIQDKEVVNYINDYPSSDFNFTIGQGWVYVYL